MNKVGTSISERATTRRIVITCLYFHIFFLIAEPRRKLRTDKKYLQLKYLALSYFTLHSTARRRRLSRSAQSRDLIYASLVACCYCRDRNILFYKR